MEELAGNQGAWGLAGAAPCPRAAGGYQSPEAPRGPFKDLRGRTPGHLPADETRPAVEKARLLVSRPHSKPPVK